VNVGEAGIPIRKPWQCSQGIQQTIGRDRFARAPLTPCVDFMAFFARSASRLWFSGVPQDDAVFTTSLSACAA